MASARQLLGHLGEISLQSDHDQDVLGMKNQIVTRINEKWPTEDRHDTNRFREAKIADLLSNSRRALRQGHPFKRGGSMGEVSLKSKEIFLHRLKF